MATPPERIPVSAIVHTRNAAATIDAALASLEWADERIVVDMASTDGTPALAAQAGARVIAIPPHPRVDDVRTRYLAEARHEWIFVLDADERLAADAGAEVQRLLHEHGHTIDAFSIPRFNSVAGRVLRGTGWYPDHQVRLFRQGTVRWRGGVHRPPEIVTGMHRLLGLLPPDCLHIHHRNYDTLADVLVRQLHYALVDEQPEDDFDFAAYVHAAHAEFARRHEPAVDGDLSTALALTMAWDRIVRGLLHWDRLAVKPPLGPAFGLPIVTHEPPVAVVDPAPLIAAVEAAETARRAAEEEVAALRATRWYRLSQWTVRRAPLVTRLAGAVSRALGR